MINCIVYIVCRLISRNIFLSKSKFLIILYCVGLGQKKCTYLWHLIKLDGSYLKNVNGYACLITAMMITIQFIQHFRTKVRKIVVNQLFQVRKAFFRENNEILLTTPVSNKKVKRLQATMRQIECQTKKGRPNLLISLIY